METTFAARLDRAMRSRGLSNQRLADRLTESGCEVGREAVRSWRKGFTQPTVGEAAAMAGILGVASEWLMTGREPGAARSEDEAFVLDAFRTARDRGLNAADIVLLIGGAVDRLGGSGQPSPDPDAPDVPIRRLAGSADLSESIQRRLAERLQQRGAGGDQPD